MLDVSLLAANFQENSCIVNCPSGIGFSLLCNGGERREHRVCMGCVFQLHRYTENNFLLCPICRTNFNFQDHLVVRELHLIQSQPEESILAYHAIMGNNPLQCSVVEKFLLLDEEDQREMISKMYWGNAHLFREDAYLLPAEEDNGRQRNSAPNERIRKNLLDMLGNPWSPKLGEAEKQEQLSQIFRNGWLVKFCQNELQETFLHRCQLFLRANVPLHEDSNQPFLSRMKNVAQFFPEYTPRLDELVEDELVEDELRTRFLDFPVVNRPATGPLAVEYPDMEGDGRLLFSTVNWGLLNQVQILNNGDLEDNLVEVCHACRNNQGFPILCKGENYTGEHKFCLDCVVDLYKSATKQFCPICHTQFNFQDYLVVRELHLIHSLPEQSVFDYFRIMMQFIMSPNSDFLWLSEKEQKELLSKIYWGNDKLFYDNELVNEGLYDPAKSEQNQRIRENLLEVFGDLWSCRLGRKEKDRKLLEFLINGLFVKSCRNESKETFLHRCNIFVRTFLPYYTPLNDNISERMERVSQFFPEYSRIHYGLESRAIGINRKFIERPLTGPIVVPPIGDIWFYRRYGAWTSVRYLKNRIKKLCLFNLSTLCFPTLFAVLGIGSHAVITATFLQLIFLAASMAFGLIYCKYFADSVHKKLDAVFWLRFCSACMVVIFIANVSLVPAIINVIKIL